MIINPYISSLIFSLVWIISTPGSIFDFGINMLRELIINYFLYIICIVLVIIILITNGAINLGVSLSLIDTGVKFYNEIKHILRKSVTYLFIVEIVTLLST